MQLRPFLPCLLAAALLAGCAPSGAPSADDAPAIGVGAPPPPGARLVLDGSRASLEANWEYWRGPRSYAST